MLFSISMRKTKLPFENIFFISLGLERKLRSNEATWSKSENLIKATSFGPQFLWKKAKWIISKILFLNIVHNAIRFELQHVFVTHDSTQNKFQWGVTKYRTVIKCWNNSYLSHLSHITYQILFYSISIKAIVSLTWTSLTWPPTLYCVNLRPPVPQYRFEEDLTENHSSYISKWYLIF